MTTYWTNGVATLHQADARALPVADGSVHCVITSPPYWGLRDYGLSDWEGGDPECSHERPLSKSNTSTMTGGAANANSSGQLQGWPNGVCGYCGARQQAAGIGLEPTLSEWLANIVAVGREVWRVLRDDGTWWLNLGDAYAGSGKGGGNGVDKQRTNIGSGTGRPHRALVNGKRTPRGEGSGRWGMGDTAVDCLPAKSLMMQPARAALALQDDGWILRSEIVWHKPNPMPESVRDRPTSAHEKVYLLVKQAKYFYDAEAVRQQAEYGRGSLFRSERYQNNHAYSNADDNVGRATNNASGQGGANLRNVWQIPTQGRPEAHFATFPDELPRRCILAGTSEHGVCSNCGAPWVRQTKPLHDYKRDGIANSKYDGKTQAGNTLGTLQARRKAGLKDNDDWGNQTLGWQPTCDCNVGRVPATVLDPFVGSGTTVAIAQHLGRRGIGTDLNPGYLAIARKTLGKIPLPMEMLL